MKETIRALCEQWGQSVSRESTGESWKAYVQPVRQKNRHEDRAVTPVGDVDWRRWLYIGSADRPLREGEILLSGEERFCVRERAAEYLGSEALYERAILIQAKEAAV